MSGTKAIVIWVRRDEMEALRRKAETKGQTVEEYAAVKVTGRKPPKDDEVIPDSDGGL